MDILLELGWERISYRHGTDVCVGGVEQYRVNIHSFMSLSTPNIIITASHEIASLKTPD